MTVHFRHLQVHQNDVEWRRLRSFPKDFHGDSAVTRNRDDGPRTFQQLGGDLLVHLVVFHQQDADTAGVVLVGLALALLDRPAVSGRSAPNRSIMVS